MDNRDKAVCGRKVDRLVCHHGCRLQRQCQSPLAVQGSDSHKKSVTLGSGIHFHKIRGLHVIFIYGPHRRTDVGNVGVRQCAIIFR
ncbi:Uncharacterised protein [Serratia plymuthica]|nr:Uncharacterised protein [Serratia plymuthica]